MFDIESRSATAPIAYLGGFLQPVRRAPRATDVRLAVTDPALHVVSHFAWEQPVTVTETRSIDDALAEMMRAGVRALLVVRDAVVIGLITSYDICGERPLQFLATSGYSRHDEIEVSHIMTPWERVPTFDWRTLGRARISDLVAYFGKTSATHAVVIKHADRVETFVRGLLSRARLARRLGHSI
jgi:CBS-domain-containing membrane protein